MSYTPSKCLSTAALLIFAPSTTPLTLLAWAGDQPSHTAMVGWLALSAGPNDPAVQALRAGLRELGYVDGQDFRIEHRSAEGHVDRLPPLADDLVRSKVDLILTATSDGTRAAMRATDTIPIVAVIPVDDPVVLGFIESLNRPGRNVTGGDHP